MKKEKKTKRKLISASLALRILKIRALATNDRDETTMREKEKSNRPTNRRMETHTH